MIHRMCNDYEQHVAWREYQRKMDEIGAALPPHQSELDLPQADDIRIGDTGPVMRIEGQAVELTGMKFGLPPTGRGGPVFNFRSDGRRFGGSQRCLIVASAFFEFTGRKYPKAKHRFAFPDGSMMAIAGIWREGAGNQPPAFAMLTTAPGPDVAPIHNRQIVVLQPADWLAWLTLSRPEAELLRPLPAGSLEVSQVRAGSD
jgi:putative SOS response-associated peptidase YedK